MSSTIIQPFSVFYDANGQPLDAGYIYIGTAGLNPESNPITVYWDTALTSPAAQPIRTLNGFPSRSGSPGTIICAQSSFSILVRNKTGSLVYSNFNATSDFNTVRYIQTNADLIALTADNGLLNNALYDVAGYSTAGDGGGGLWRYVAGSTATADGGTILASVVASGRFIRLFTGSIQPQWFGARGNGVTNDATALQAAINATISTGGLLAFNPGIYELGTSSLNITGGCQISGLGATLRRSGDAITPVLNVTGSNVSISNITIVSTFAGAPTADANNCALLFSGGANVYAENVSVSGRFYIGIELASVNNGVLTDCKVKGVRNRGIYVYLNWSDISLTNCVIDGAEAGTTPYCDYGVNFNPGGTFQPSRATVTGCIITNCTSQGIAVSERSLYTSIANCVVQNIPSGYGFLVQRANSFDGIGAQISNCSASSCLIGFYVTQSFYVDIVSCNAILNTNDGIQINDSQYIGVTGCITRNNTQNGIYVFASGASLASRITITGNRSVANGGTGILSNANCYGLAVSTNIAISNTTAQINILGTANQVGNGANIVV